ncbi:MAG: type II toxin-antitoxin system ParD family antitoxin [Mariprofundaceae bacterium]|nr:type II toxin-antitoxin system ParD family antitoxin [Mariprofundaceae bacterium]
MNYSLSKKLENYVADQVDSGSFNNASEVVRDALRLHEEYQLKLEILRQDVQTGVSSVRAGRISRATPEEIIEKAKARRS